MSIVHLVKSYITKTKLFNIYIVVYKPLFPIAREHDLKTICESEIALIGGSMGARIDHGFWKIIGNSKPNIDRIPRPKFITNIRDKPFIVNFDGKVIRRAKRKDLDKYHKIWEMSPMGFEMAIKAIHGKDEWVPGFDKMLYEDALNQSI